MRETIYFDTGLDSWSKRYIKLTYESYTPSAKQQELFKDCRNPNEQNYNVLSAETVYEFTPNIQAHRLHFALSPFEISSYIPLALQPNSKIAILELGAQGRKTFLFELDIVALGILPNSKVASNYTLLDGYLLEELQMSMLDNQQELKYERPPEYYGIPNDIIELFESTSLMGGTTLQDHLLFEIPPARSNQVQRSRKYFLDFLDKITFALNQHDEICFLEYPMTIRGNVHAYIDCNDYKLSSLFFSARKGIQHVTQKGYCYLDNITLSQLAKQNIRGKLTSIIVRATIDELIDPKNFDFLKSQDLAYNKNLIISDTDFEQSHNKLLQFLVYFIDNEIMQECTLYIVKEPFDSIISYLFAENLIEIKEIANGFLINSVTGKGDSLEVKNVTYSAGKMFKPLPNDFLYSQAASQLNKAIYETIHTNLNGLGTGQVTKLPFTT